MTKSPLEAFAARRLRQPAGERRFDRGDRRALRAGELDLRR